MQTKTLVYFSVACYSLCGLALIFLPQELLAVAGATSSAPMVLLAQLFGAALLGMAQMNWIARGSMLGGIYGRAVVAGNFTFAFISALLVIRALLAFTPPLWLWLGGVMSVALAVAFAYLMFGEAR